MPEQQNTHLQVQTKLPTHVRAGIVFSLGYNLLPLDGMSQEVRDKLEADPHLAVKEITAEAAEQRNQFQGAQMLELPQTEGAAKQAAATPAATPQQVHMAVASLDKAAGEKPTVDNVTKALKDQGLKVAKVKAADIKAAQQLPEASADAIATAIYSLNLAEGETPDLQTLNAALHADGVNAVATAAGLEAAITVNQ
jgi:hypothetical protein